MNLAIRAEDQRICSPDQGRPIRDDIGNRQHRFFVGNGHVAANETCLGKRAEHRLKVLTCDVDRDVIAADAIGLKPVSMQDRRLGMRDGRADHASQRDAGMVGHVVSSPRIRNQFNNSMSGKPRTAK